MAVQEAPRATGSSAQDAYGYDDESGNGWVAFAGILLLRHIARCLIGERWGRPR
jgi:hypothetical protein